MKTLRVIFIENPHIATINAADFDDAKHVEIDWAADPKAALKYLKAHGATAEALANVPATAVEVEDEPEGMAPDVPVPQATSDDPAGTAPAANAPAPARAARGPKPPKAPKAPKGDKKAPAAPKA